ncbi:PREDICTED: RELT-like protein 2 [Nanorana parkeri]|uniref:RELT-like protein 2 n=1 Tax=Nanorana parkeri TaxID=125878 RepID=UPI0008545EF8|nr:PREDICTED: RELT-like protein 2 [Nanorana parkeri]
MVEHQTVDERPNEQQSPYMLFLLVVVFFITGLVGILICHILKKKGYRCRTSPEELDPEMKDCLSREQEITDEISNEDTVERIVKCIIQNEANAEALKQMLGDTEGEVPIIPNLCPHRESQDAGPSHHHTVHGSSQAPCIHCTRKKRNLLHRMGRSKDSKGKVHPGEVTVFSVGRFRVTHIGKKSSIHLSLDDPNIGSEPDSSEKVEAQQTTKSINGVDSHRASVGLSQNGPESVGLTKLESQKDTETRLDQKNGVKGLQKKPGRILTKNKGFKDRRNSAPEQTVVQRERVDILSLQGSEQRKETTESAEKQV